ncbi:MAG: DUF2157 domain-containing protein [Flavobacteriaceae bacterium]
MLDALYHRRLLHDLEDWQRDGLIDAASARRIVAKIDDQRSPGGIATWLAGLGVVLVAAAAIAFVAANWEAVPRLARCGILVAGMAVAYLGGWVLHSRGLPRVADLAIGLGAALFGAAIFLVAQSYHLSGDPENAILLWAAGALLAALLGASRSALLLAFGLFSYWAFLVFDYGRAGVPWEYLIVIAVTALSAHAMNFPRALHLAVLGLFAWTAALILDHASEADWQGYYGLLAVLSTMIAFGGIGAVLRTRFTGTPQIIGEMASGYAIFFGLAGICVMQFGAGHDIRFGNIDNIAEPAIIAAVAAAVAVAGLAFAAADRSIPRWAPLALAGFFAILFATGFLTISEPTEGGDFAILVILAGLTLGGAVAMIVYGQSVNWRRVTRFGALLFAFEIFYLYTVLFSSLLDSATFFLIGGVLLIVMAFWLLRRERKRKQEAAA